VNRNSKIFVAGHRGLAGSALLRSLQAQGYTNLVLRTHAELDLQNPAAVDEFFAAEAPEVVFLAAAKVGGIQANNTYPAEFIYRNLMIEANVIDAAYRHGVKELLFLGSSCIYPRDAAQPMREDCLLTAPLEPTNRPYAIAKIAGIELCWAYNRQYGTRYMAAMPTNLYGPGDNYNLQSSHVLPALIRKVHEAKQNQSPELVVWGSGTPLREFLYSGDFADACLHIMSCDDALKAPLFAADQPPLINVGSGSELTIRQLAETVCRVLGFTGSLTFDASKPDGTPRKLMDSSRLRSLGWVPRINLDEGIQLAYQQALESGLLHS